MIGDTIALGVEGYAALGCIFTIAFVARGVQRIDAAAQAAGWPFRLIVCPGAVALWPYLAVRWARANGGRR
jgi:hypothetical protein